MKKTIYNINFEKLVELGIITEDGTVPQPHRRSKSSGYMDLVVERHVHLDHMTGTQGTALSLTHYFKQNGDLCMDPEMVLIVYPDRKMTEALTFEQSIPPIYQQVFPEPNKFSPQLKKELNRFLKTWLNNLIAQGHGQHWESNTE